MPFSDILPPNSTDLERDLLDAMVDNREDFLLRAERIKTIKYESIPPAIVGWLVHEYGLEKVSEFLPADPTTAIASGLEWQRKRGTRAAFDIAFGWIDLIPTSIDERFYITDIELDFAKYQIDPGLIPSRDMLKAIVKLSEESAPKRSELVRIYHGLDISPCILNESKLNNCLLNNFSGFYDEDLGVWLSFRDTQGFVIENNEAEVFTGSFVQAGYVVDATAVVANATVDFGSYVNTGYVARNLFSGSDDIMPVQVISDITYIVYADPVSAFTPFLLDESGESIKDEESDNIEQG